MFGVEPLYDFSTSLFYITLESGFLEKSSITGSKDISLKSIVPPTVSNFFLRC